MLCYFSGFYGWLAIYGVLSRSRICRNLRFFGANFFGQNCICIFYYFLHLCCHHLCYRRWQPPHHFRLKPRLPAILRIFTSSICTTGSNGDNDADRRHHLSFSHLPSTLLSSKEAGNRTLQTQPGAWQCPLSLSFYNIFFCLCHTSTARCLPASSPTGTR